MLEVKATTARSSDNVLKVDLSYLLTDFPREYANRNFRADVFRAATCTYGDMLSQQLRQINGVGAVRINHYSFEAEIGWAFDYVRVEESVREMTEFVLSQAVPWVVTRNSDGSSNWRYTYGDYLGSTPGSPVQIRQMHYEEDGSGANALTDLGRKVIQSLRGDDGEICVGHITDGSAFMYGTDRFLSKQLRGLDSTFDYKASKVAGLRRVGAVWDNAL